MRHHEAVEWEARLKAVFDRVDEQLEKKYGHLYPLHPARARHGSTGNREEDGLLDLGAAFTAGFGSQRGHGYVVTVRMVTLADVPAEVRKKIEEEVVRELRRELPHAFPKRGLSVERDGNVFKITGDLSLGKA